MDPLVLRRGGFRSSFTKTVNALKSEIGKEECSEGLVRDKFTKLQSVHKDIAELNEEILNSLISEGANQEKIIEEMEGWETYSDEFITMTRLVGENLRVPDEGENNSVAGSRSDGFSASRNNTRSYKLPKIQLKQFDGELLNWLPFWSQFEKIHEDPDLHESDKFQYLVQSMKPGSRAKELVESYPMTTKNYSQAVNALTERFGKSDLLIEVYVRELIKLIISNVRGEGKEKLSLPQLFDKLEAQLRALDSLGIKTETNSCWLYPMVESGLSEDVLRAWQRSFLFNEGNDNKEISRLKNLMKFLKSEVEGEERLKLARSGFETSGKEKFRDKFKGEFETKFKRNKSANIPSAAGFLTTKDQGCIFCGKLHDSKDCFESKNLTLQEKTNKIREKRCCLKCLSPGHIAKICKQFVRCYACGKAHTISLCPQMQNPESQVENHSAETVQATTVGQQCTAEVALMTLEVKVVGKEGARRVRALLDCGSQKSYVLRETAERLGLTPVGKETIAHTLFGGAKTAPKAHKRYSIRLRSTNPHADEGIECLFLDQEIICGDVPRIPKGPFAKELKRLKVWLSDMGPGSPKIEMLIGSDIYGRILTGQVKQLECGLTAINTKLGWTICGSHEEHTTKESGCLATVGTHLAIQNLNVSDLWALETIGISDCRGNLTKIAEEELAREQFLSSLTRKEDGRYSVGLPWLEKEPDLPSNRLIAEKRLISTTRKLRYLNVYEDYNKVIQEWHAEGVIEEVPREDLDSSRGHYLPHHPVVKPESLTTKIRPVFDASCKVDRSPSLNDCLVKGPNLIEEIPAILLRFREKRIGVTADIRRAFLQIELEREDRDFLRFLWWERDDLVKVYRHTRVVFGVTSSPFLLGAVISFHLSQVPPNVKPLAEKLKRSFYIDNCVTSLENERELREFVEKSTEILAEAKMDLRMWLFGPVGEISENLATMGTEHISDDPISVLGVLWDKGDDSLSIPIKALSDLERLSKREMLSLTQGIFDPLGFLTPVLVIAKLLIQEVWAKRSDWDTPLPDDIRLKFIRWINDLQLLSEVKVPRRIGFGDKDTWTLHVFCDASQNAYATVVFLRSEENGETFVRFLASKSRVTPLKKITIPRLELLACVLGARLAKYILEALSLKSIPQYFWSDSTTALSWIKRNDQWGTFVGNRVREICALTDVNQWSYVPTQMNPADLPSRGCTARHMLKEAWWEGPDWLRGPRDSWPTLDVKPNEGLISAERKKGLTLVNVNVKSEPPKWYEKISKFSKIVRTLAWVLRFIRNCQKKFVSRETFLSVAEVQEARNAVILLVQKESFSQTEESVNGLTVIRDQAGLIRVKTKIIERNDEFNFKYPVLLPSKHHLVECIILEYHQNNCHAGIQVLMSMIREDFWILAARRTIRSAIRKCTRCQRFSVKSPTTVPIHLPADRVRDASTFEITGIDLCGPLVLRDQTKAWVVLFTCAVYRAVHLELVSKVSSETFLQALRRFISRRGRPMIIYCDNGTNFTGASAALRKINWQKVIGQEVLKPIEWKFIPPTAAWWGGWWERLIRSTKGILVRVLGRASVTYEELLTILCDAEAVLNSRPLTYLSSDAEDLVPLTPSNFLQDVKEIGTPDLDYLDREKLSSRQKYCQELRQQFRNRFRKEYLGQLVQKTGRGSKDLKVGEVVLVGSENQKRLNWPLAVVQELFPGRDGHVRVVRVKTQYGNLVRPVQKLYPLEVSSCGDPILSEHPQNCPIAAEGTQLSTEIVPARGDPQSQDSQPAVPHAKCPTVRATARTGIRGKTVPMVPRKTRCGRLVKAPLRLNYS